MPPREATALPVRTVPATDPRPWPVRLSETVRFWAFLTALGGLFLGWSLLAGALLPLLPHRAGTRLGRRVISGGFGWLLNVMRRMGLARLDLSELEALRSLRGTIVAANHLSMIDVMLVISRMPDAACILRADLLRNPALWGARLAGFIPNDAPLPMVRRAAEVLRQGGNLLIFPEGTRSPDRRLGPFRPGFALIARAAKAPVQLVVLENDTPYLSKGWPIWRQPRFPLTYRARLAGRFEWTGDAETFSATLHAALLAAQDAPSPKRDP
ncbi:lysophospholipid acyltransferase family protein [Roseomonas sp. CCTCC AB2023176]|uniref:lysophospholipid acyltransferase family protein n=1 Tax=Roseomonas sp. CCTCC AB2023176 TaxID=3342640 RepID=UPI0035E3B008